jgi:hypothetical protein
MPVHLNVPDYDPVFADKHAIGQDVWRRRGYRLLTIENYGERIKEAFPGASEHQLRDVRRKIKEDLEREGKEKGPTWIMQRFAVLPGLPQIFPEYRPDKPVTTRPPHKHFHADGVPIPPPPSKCPRGPHRKGDGTYIQCPCCVHPRDIHTAAEMAEHIKTSKGKTKTKAKAPTDHRGKNSNQPHPHIHRGKYQHLPNERVDQVGEHDHSWYASRQDQEKLRIHIKYHHGGVAPPPGFHPQVRRNVKDRRNGSATRLDIHPWAAEWLRDARIVFFVIEGVIKADAVLTYILKHNLDASVFSVPAVWQWDARELPDFARRHLLGKRVYIVADADGYKNERGVMRPARLCLLRLLWLGVEDVHIALPPAKTRRKWKGVDDFLAGGGHLEDLEITDYKLKPIFWHGEIRRDRRDGERDHVLALSVLVDPDGNYSGSIRSLARVFEVEARTVIRILKRLEASYHITLSGDLKTRQRAWLNQYFEIGSIEEWDIQEGEAAPVITLDHKLRAEKLPKARLGEMPHRKEVLLNHVG